MVANLSQEQFTHSPTGWTKPSAHHNVYPTGYLCGKLMGHHIRVSPKMDDVTCPDCLKALTSDTERLKRRIMSDPDLYAAYTKCISYFLLCPITLS